MLAAVIAAGAAIGAAGAGPGLICRGRRAVGGGVGERNAVAPAGTAWRGSRPRRRIAAVAGGLALAVGLASCGGSAAGVGSSGQASGPRAGETQPAPSPPRRPARPGPSGGIEISIRASPYGRILSVGDNRTVYRFTRDRGSTSACYGACQAAWPPVLGRAAPRRGHGLTAPLGTTRRSDGTRQVTYAGHPLYYYVGDRRPGQILCQDVTEFGGRWLVVSPTGSAVT